MKWVRLANNKVVEIIPEKARQPSVAHWYGAEFAAQCVEAPEEVQQNWIFDEVSGTFSEPSLLAVTFPALTPEEIIMAKIDYLAMMTGVSFDE